MCLEVPVSVQREIFGRILHNPPSDKKGDILWFEMEICKSRESSWPGVMAYLPREA